MKDAKPEEIKEYLNLTTKKLLKKFGRGSHKPGSGSAAVLQAMLSAQLMLTVINRSVNKVALKDHHEIFVDFRDEIEEKIYPSLEKLFVEDSEKFHEHMVLRLQARDEKDPNIKHTLRDKAQKKLKPATEVPIDIGRVCNRLSKIGLYLYDKGFVAVRGDSSVAIQGVLAAIGGCISIVNLNLSSFARSKWTEKLRGECDKLLKQYNQLKKEIDARISDLRKESNLKMDLQYFKKLYLKDDNLTNEAIENVAKNLQNCLWLNKGQIFGDEAINNPLSVLEPLDAIEFLGFNVEKRITLGKHTIEDEMYETAGMIDREKKTVYLSEKFPKEVQYFTAAHELGHLLFHNQSGLHRDRSLNGENKSRGIVEQQADKFATYFLMPENQVKLVFNELFGVEKFSLNEKVLYDLGVRGIKNTQDFKKKYKSKLEVALLLARIESFSGKAFNSMANIFIVSNKAMAIRLVELDLIDIEY